MIEASQEVRGPMTQGPMSDAVDLVMLKLAMVYGMPKMDAFYRGLDKAEVKAHWVAELRGLTVGDVLYALENLPTDHVPNVLQFRAIAMRRPDEGLLALNAPEPANPARVARAVEALQALRVNAVAGHPQRAWIYRLQARLDAGREAFEAIR